MRTPLLFIFVLLINAGLFGQNGYIKFHKHSIAEGYVSIHEAKKIHEQQIEIRQSEDDPHPKHYHKKDIVEYAIMKDTFRILKDFYPYEIQEIYFDLVEARVIQSGKISLLRIDNAHQMISKSAGGSVSSEFHDETATKVPHMFVLHDTENNYFRGIPTRKEKFEEVIPDFFSDNVLALYEKEHGKIHYKDLEKLVKFNKSFPDK